MDIAPVFELRARLRAAAIAGTNLLSEDFRLRKAAESFSALSDASPVFAKIRGLTDALLSDKCEDKPGVLLDTITLVDSVICTLAATEVPGEIEDIVPPADNPNIISNAPYSQLSKVIEALTTSGGGQHGVILETQKENPEIFRDYRVLPALVKGLGASYSELADTVTDILGGMGKEILPLVKKDFDPKGKKEMIRRIEIIEKLGGAEENVFYSEQLENAEKDVRKSLVYALRHDEGNVDKLIELAKTEKGKSKNAALYALMSLDCEKSHAFFEEYAKKKPVEVIKLLDAASSEWSSGFTARLIDELLVDENGNKVTLSEASDLKRVKLKAKVGVWELMTAMKGKFGRDIEKLYREFNNQSETLNHDFDLAVSIIITDNEGLKKLAKELNGNSKMKGRYVFAEAAARLLGEEDCSKWIEEQICAVYKERLRNTSALLNTQIARALLGIKLIDGEYCLAGSRYDPILDKFTPYASRPIKQPVRGAITDIFIKYRPVGFERMLSEWADKDDKEYCEKLANYFIEQGTAPEGSTICLSYLRNVGMENVKGLAVKYCKNNPQDNKWSVRGVFNVLCGDHEYKLAEAREVVELMRSGKLKTAMSKEDIEEFASWAETRFTYLNS